jgi:hypothetical protein
VGWTLVLRSREIDAFRGCRRAWDLGALGRRGLVPRVRGSVFDLQLAVRMGLAVYYFPAMDDWSRAIVRPLAIKGFNRAMSEQASAFELARPLDAAETSDWQRHRRLGEGLLTRYFDWADRADDFDALFADELVWSPIPDPADPSRDLGTPDGRPIRFASRFDALVSDANDEHWVLDHRVAWDDWASDEALLADDAGVRTIWALEVAYPQLLLAGTIVNELRVARDDLDRFAPGVPKPGAAAPARDPRDMARVRHPAPVKLPLTPTAEQRDAAAPPRDEVAARAGDEHTRRMWIRRSRDSIAAAGRRVARDAQLMARPDLAAAPNPAPVRCARCAFLEPCAAMQAGYDEQGEGMLLRDYRRRGELELEDAGLRRSDERAADEARRGVDRARHANFRWS